MRPWTVRAGAGAVSVVSRPVGDEFLVGDLSEIREAGMDVLVGTHILMRGDEEGLGTPHESGRRDVPSVVLQRLARVAREHSVEAQ